MKMKLIREVGDKVFIRTLTYHYTGQIAAISDQSIVLEKASWIADSGRFSKALETGELSEIEPIPDQCYCEINRQNIVDIIDWNHDLPRVVK